MEQRAGSRIVTSNKLRVTSMLLIVRFDRSFLTLEWGRPLVIKTKDDFL